MWLFPFYRWKSSGKQMKWHARGQHKMSLLRGGMRFEDQEPSWHGRCSVQQAAECQVRSFLKSSWFMPLVWFWVVPGVLVYLRELNCYFQSSSFFAWLAFVTTLKPEEVLGAGSLFSIHIFWRWKQAGLCCSCTEDIHLVSVQGAPAPFSAGGCCWSWNAITEAVIRGSNLLKKRCK